MMIPKISQVADPGHIRRCAPVLRELRSALTEEEIVQRVQQQMKQGYSLVCIEHDDIVQSVAGYRILENLHYGKFLYVDDLVTWAEGKRNGFASRLFDWLLQQATEEGCSALVLDSGVQRFEAHRFYLQHRMDIVVHHFLLRLAGC
jgi:predicted N-acetyltransferase YhbS